MSLILPHLHLSSLGHLTGALVVLMTAAAIDTVPAPLWVAVVVEADTHLPRTTTTTTVAAHLEATARAGTTTAAVHPRASSMIGVKEVMAVRRLVVACLMSMALRARVTLTILMMLGPDHPQVVATMTLT